MRTGWDATLENRRIWGEMRMMPTDIEDLQGFTPLINGRGPDQNWTGLFEPGERVRLRFINSSAMTHFDVRIPGLKVTVVQADGNNVLPVKVDEFRIAVAETYDVIVRPKDGEAYTIFAESMGRTAYARGTLAVREGLTAEVPEMREDPLLTMSDMRFSPLHRALGHDAHGGQAEEASAAHGEHSGHGGSGETHVMADGTVMQGSAHEGHGDHAGHGAHGKSQAPDPFYAPNSGLRPTAANGGKFLSYSDLKAQKPLYEHREATREIEIRLTGSMERYTWSLNDVKYSEADPIVLQYGERVRFKFINETMMTHPMHLHGMWSIIDNGSGARNPVKHTVSVAPGTIVYMETEVDAPGQWAFHCHLAYHADAGMFRKVIVEGGPADQKASLSSAQGG